MKKEIRNIAPYGKVEIRELTVRLYPAEIEALRNILGYSKEELESYGDEDDIEELLGDAIRTAIRTSKEGRWKEPKPTTSWKVELENGEFGTVWAGTKEEAESEADREYKAEWMNVCREVEE